MMLSKSLVSGRALRLTLIWTLGLHLSCRPTPEEEEKRAPAATSEAEDDGKDELTPASPSAKLALYTPAQSARVLTSTANNADTFYTEVLAGRIWGVCERYLDGKSVLTSESYLTSSRTIIFAMTAYSGRDCTGVRLANYSYQAFSRINAFTRSSVNGIYFLDETNQSSGVRFTRLVRLVDGRMESMQNVTGANAIQNASEFSKDFVTNLIE